MEIKKQMSNHFGKRERRARKRQKRRTLHYAWQSGGESGSLTLKLGERKRAKINWRKAANLPF